MTEQPPRSTREKVEHQFSRLASRPVTATAAEKSILAIEEICKDSMLDLLKYIPEGTELDQGLLRYREAFHWFTHAVLVNHTDNSSADGKLVQDQE